MNTIHATREDWLKTAIEEVRPMFAAEGLSLAPKIRVTCGLPSVPSRAIATSWLPGKMDAIRLRSTAKTPSKLLLIARPLSG